MSGAVYEMDTFFTPTEQSLLFMYSVGIGAVLGVCYDVLRTFRLVVPHKKIFTALEDIFFFLLWGLSFVVFSLVMAHGEIRIYYLIGNVLGFLVYFFTVGMVVVRVIKGIGFIAKSIVKFIYKILFKPIVKSAEKLFVNIHQKSNNKIMQKKLKLQNIVSDFKIHLKERDKIVYNNEDIIKKEVLRRGKKTGEKT